MCVFIVDKHIYFFALSTRYQQISSIKL